MSHTEYRQNFQSFSTEPVVLGIALLTMKHDSSLSCWYRKEFGSSSSAVKSSFCSRRLPAYVAVEKKHKFGRLTSEVR